MLRKSSKKPNSLRRNRKANVVQREANVREAVAGGDGADVAAEVAARSSVKTYRHSRMTPLPSTRSSMRIMTPARPKKKACLIRSRVRKDPRASLAKGVAGVDADDGAAAATGSAMARRHSA